MKIQSLEMMAALSLLLAGAIFGFFYAWVCSTMWGLDATDPRVAIRAMQAMNASVRNAVFAPAFFTTPFVLFGTAWLAWRAGLGRACLLFAAAGGVYLFGAQVLTMTVNVPMNEALGATTVPASLEEAQAIWSAYSPRWQMFNIIRTVVSGISLLMAGAGIYFIGRGVPAAA